MKKWLKPILACLVIVGQFGFTSAEKSKADLYVRLNNIRNADGVFYVFLYNYENQYPHEPYTYYKVSKANVKNGKLLVRISDIDTQHKYAITLIDDENDNEDLDRFLGLPTEGFGFSNNIHPLFSLPDYKELIFSFASEKTINIEVQYFL